MLTRLSFLLGVIGGIRSLLILLSGFDDGFDRGREGIPARQKKKTGAKLKLFSQNQVGLYDGT